MGPIIATIRISTLIKKKSLIGKWSAKQFLIFANLAIGELYGWQEDVSVDKIWPSNIYLLRASKYAKKSSIEDK
jgi:hypothetical protein